MASQGVTWVSSNTDIATISESGVVKGIKVGKVTILAISKIKSDIMASIEINVVLPEPESISINGAKDILINENITLEAIINPNLADQSVIWSSNFPEIASVSPSGIVTGLKAGKVQITAKSEVKDTVSKTIEINITLPMPESITIEGVRSIFIDEKSILKGKVLPLLAEQELIWSSSNPDIASISVDGMVTGKKTGKIQISAKSKVDESIVEIIEFEVLMLNAKDIKIIGETKMLIETEQLLRAFVTPLSTSQDVIWSSSNPEVAVISTTGLVKAISCGEVEITAEAKYFTEIKGKINIRIISEILENDNSLLVSENLSGEFGDEIVYNFVKYNIGITAFFNNPGSCK